MYGTATLRVLPGSKLLFGMQRYPSGALLSRGMECLGSGACGNFLTDLSATVYICYMLCLKAVCNSCGLMFIFGVISVRISSTTKFYRGVHLAFFFFLALKMFSHLHQLKATVEQLSLYWNVYKSFQ